eukprot:GHVU01162247.1.p1 GENE.GHVU01162247.1~~GHVU01162247.1.p1  ORF type:complete len:111 (+),score=12.75 GHVU01162247.1:81-413(+)
MLCYVMLCYVNNVHNFIPQQLSPSHRLKNILNGNNRKVESGTTPTVKIEDTSKKEDGITESPAKAETSLTEGHKDENKDDRHLYGEEENTFQDCFPACCYARLVFHLKYS